MAGKKSNGSAGELHGMTKSREYQIWARMNARCRNPKSTDWKYYGGRGIAVCDRWAQSFLTFLADMGPCPPKHSLDRYPNQDGNYEPGNVRWATQAQQTRNTSRNRLITYNGKTQCLMDWANELGVSFACLHRRLAQGLSTEKALTYEYFNGTAVTFDGRTMNVSQWARETGIKFVTLHRRLSAGWSAEKALTTPVRGGRNAQHA